MEVDSEVPVAAAETTIASENADEPKELKSPTETKSPHKIDSSKGVDDIKKNGTLAGVAAAAATNAAAAATKKEDNRGFMAGVVVQFPEMFSMKRDGHILEKFTDATDVRMQKYAFVECESEEVAIKLQAKLNNSTINNKKVSASRLDTTEKNKLYLGALKKEITDEILKSLLPGIEEIRREKYNTFVLFKSETECRAARTKVIKEGIKGQNVLCDFDLRKDRFKAQEEPAAKKPKEDGDAQKDKEVQANKNDKKEEGDSATDAAKADDSTKAPEEEADVKADEW